MSCISIVSQFLYFRTLPEHEEIKKQLLPKILEQKDVYKNNNMGMENAYTTYNNDPTTVHPVSNDTTFLLDEQIITPVVRQSIKEAIDHMKRNNMLPLPCYKGYTISRSWYTRYAIGVKFQSHSHGQDPVIIQGYVGQPAFSIIYILNDQNDKNSTFFESHDRNYLPRTSSIQIDTANIHDIKEGTVIVFPSTFLHGVTSIKVPNRVTISYNVYGIMDPGLAE